MEALEIETVKQKCDGWKERADQLSCELENVQALLEQTQRDKQFMEQSLNHRLEVRLSTITIFNLIIFTRELNILFSWLLWKVTLDNIR